MRLSRHRRVISAAATVLTLAYASRADGAAGSARIQGTTMGTSYSIEIAATAPDLPEDAVRDGIEAVLAAIEREMSTYRADSELSRFNASESTEWTPVSGDLARVAAEALRIGRLSRGAFDVTVQPLVELWGFGVDRQAQRRPTAEALAAARARVGYQRLESRASPPGLRKQRPDLAVDLSAIATGFAVDRIAEYLAGAGLRNYLIEISGELRARGRNASGQQWKVAIESPDGAPAAASAVVRLDSAAIATSGTYRSYFDEDGKRYSHVLDPRSGMPIRHDLLAVSVVAPTAMQADALATALLVLGADEGVQLAEQENIAALFIGTDARQRTTAFAAYELP